MSGAVKKRLLFLINSRSGGQKVHEIIASLRQYAAQKDNSIQVEELSNHASLDRILEMSANDVLIVGGGDGTFSTLLPQLAQCRAAIGILPLGTGNDLARELNITTLLECDDAAQIVTFFREASRREIIYFNLEFGDGFSSKLKFINYVSLGFDAKIVTDFARLRERNWWRNFRGVWANRMGYAGMGMRNLFHVIKPEGALTIGSLQSTATFNVIRSVIFTNIRSIMGLGKSNLHSSIFDDQIECVVVKSVINYLTMLLHFRIPLFHPRVLGSSQVWELSNVPADVLVQVDGEPKPEVNSSQYRISPAGKLMMIIG